VGVRERRAGINGEKGEALENITGKKDI